MMEASVSHVDACSWLPRLWKEPGFRAHRDESALVHVSGVRVVEDEASRSKPGRPAGCSGIRLGASSFSERDAAWTSAWL